MGKVGWGWALSVCAWSCWVWARGVSFGLRRLGFEKERERRGESDGGLLAAAAAVMASMCSLWVWAREMGMDEEGEGREFLNEHITYPSQ